MQKNNIVGIVALFLILAGIVLYAALRPAPAKAPYAANLPLPAGDFAEHAPYYDITANYATSTPLRGSANDAAIALMQNFVADTITQFKTDGNFSNLTPQDITMMGFDRGRKEKLNIVYLVFSSPRTISYVFTTYLDTLGAHGNMFFHTFTFNTATGAPISLADLFLPGTDYLGKLSALARADLPAVIGPDATDARMINDGTTPEDKNFSSFFIDNGTLCILFAPYAVAPYSAGPQTLQIPLSELSSILKPEYR